MATLTLNPVQQPDINTSSASSTRGIPPSVGQSAIATVVAPQDDSVSLSAAAQPPAAAAPATDDLSDDDATAAALSLREELSTQVLSVTARQNQAIVSLLRP